MTLHKYKLLFFI